ncbi:hypothetical protein COBT_001952, partial [Conglomerata obtusa]
INEKNFGDIGNNPVKKQRIDYDNKGDIYQEDEKSNFSEKKDLNNSFNIDNNASSSKVSTKFEIEEQKIEIMNKYKIIIADLNCKIDLNGTFYVSNNQNILTYSLISYKTFYIYNPLSVYDMHVNVYKKNFDVTIDDKKIINEKQIKQHIFNIKNVQIEILNNKEEFFSVCYNCNSEIIDELICLIFK